MAHPINEEVARLVGFGNLFDTEVVRSDPSAQVTWVKWTPDIALAVNTPRSFACGERVKMGIASGDVAVIKDGRTPQDKGQAIRVVLERATVLGESVHLTLSSIDRSPRLKAVVTKRFFERAQLASGMPLEVELPRDRLLLL